MTGALQFTKNRSRSLNMTMYSRDNSTVFLQSSVASAGSHSWLVYQIYQTFRFSLYLSLRNLLHPRAYFHAKVQFSLVT